jgi:Zn-finger nucleic acid-binding protein
MLCPKCASNATQKTFHGVLVDRCDVCEGIWLDKGELDLLVHGREKPAAELQYEARREKVLTQMVQAKGMCPRCSGKLETFVHGPSGVRLDRCRECKGLWFDFGELEKVRSAEKGSGFLHFLKDIVPGWD